jgi:hypothetical protein
MGSINGSFSNSDRWMSARYAEFPLKRGSSCRPSISALARDRYPAATNYESK